MENTDAVIVLCPLTYHRSPIAHPHLPSPSPSARRLVVLGSLRPLGRSPLCEDCVTILTCVEHRAACCQRASMPDAPRPIRLLDLVEHAESLEAHVPLGAAQPEFVRRGRRFLGVIEAGRFVGVASVREISELLSLQFGHALFGRAPLGQHVLKRALAVAPDVPLTELFTLIAGRSDSAFDEDVALVADGRRFLGLIPMHRLVKLQTSLLLDNLAEVDRQRGELAERNRRMVDDLRMAREVQLALLGGGASRACLDGRAVEVSCLYEPSEEIGGDFYAVCVPRPGVLSVFVGDVMGHGVRSALITAMLRAFVCEAHPAIADPGRLLTEINTGLCDVLRSVGELIFVTAALAVIDLESGLLHYAQAGHPRPLVWRAASGEAGELLLDGASAGPALGLVDDATYAATQVRLDPGDSLLMFTDGLIEAASPTGEEFSVERLVATFLESMSAAATGDDAARAVVEAARAFSCAPGFADDVCVLLIRRT